MSTFEDIFKSFFGKHRFPEGPQRDGPSINGEDDQSPFHDHGFFPSSPGGFHNQPPHDMDDDDDDEGPPGRRGPFPGGGFFSFENDMNEFLRLFDDAFKSFGMADFPPLDVPRISPPSSAQPEVKSPRDHMLKEPDFTDSSEPSPPSGTTIPKSDLKEPLSWFDELRKGKSILSFPPDVNVDPSASKKEDLDLDDVVRQGEMDRIFGGRSPRQPLSDQPQTSYSRSISIQTIRKPDGTYETRRTERDGKGNVTTSVTTGTDDVPSPGRMDPGSLNPGGMHPWKPSLFWPHTRRCPGSDGFERERIDDNSRRPGMFRPGSRSYPEPNRQEEEADDSLYNKFFGSWFKH